MFTGIRAVLVAVKDAKEAAKVFSDNFGLEVSKYQTFPDRGLRNAVFNIGSSLLELVEPLDPNEGPLVRFLQSRGEGIYLLGLEVENLEEAIKTLKERGVRLINADAESRAKGRLVFIHPQSTKGVLIELRQRK